MLHFFVDQTTSAIYLWEIPRLINNLLMKSEWKFFLCSSIWKFHFLQTAKCPWVGNLSFMTQFSQHHNSKCHKKYHESQWDKCIYSTILLNVISLEINNK